MLFLAARVAERRRDRGLKLNRPEAVALISDAVIEAARDGLTVADAMTVGTQTLGPDDVLDGVREATMLIQVEATFTDGTKLISVHDPIGGK